MPELTPDTLIDGRYLVKEKLGEGGMAHVYKAVDRKLGNRQVVIKVLHEKCAAPEAAAKKFLDEKSALERIKHPGVVSILDFGELENIGQYLVMDFVDGVTLQSLIAPPGFAFPRAAAIIRQLGAALAAAHQVFIYHRDISPNNIMLTRGGEGDAILIDFGIAAIREPGASGEGTTTVFGKPLYMAPERNRLECTAATDIYSLAVVTWEMLTGITPFEVYKTHGGNEVTERPGDSRKGIPRAAEELILQALKVDPAARPQSAAEFGEQLAAALLIPDRPTDRRENAYILCMDIVEYTKLPDQSAAYEALKKIAKSAPHYNDAIVRSAGDFLAFVFFGNHDAPLECAIRIAKQLKEDPQFKIGRAHV